MYYFLPYIIYYHILLSLSMSAFKELKDAGAIISAGRVFQTAFQGLSQAWLAFTAGLEGVTGAAGVAKAALSGLFTLVSAHPIIAAVAAVGALAVAYDKLHVSAKEANENMQNSMGEYDKSNSDLENLNQQLDETKSSIAELNAKGSLSFVEESELEKLKKASSELQIQADLKEKETERKAKDAAEKTVDAYHKNFKHEISEKATKQDYENGSAFTSFNDASDISMMLAGIQQYDESRKKAIIRGDVEEAQSYADTISDTTKSVWEQVDSLSEYKNNLESLPYDQLTQEQKDTLDTIDDAIEHVYQTLDPEKWKSMKLDDIFNEGNFADAKDSLVEMAKNTNNVGITVDQLRGKYPLLATAVEKAGLSVQDVVDNINSDAGILDIDQVKRQLKNDFIPDMEDDSLLVKAKFENDWSEFTKDFKDEDFEILYTIKQSNDTDGWSIDEWKNQYDAMKNGVDNSEPITFASIMGDTEDGSLSKSIDDFQEKTSTVNTALQTLQEGGKLSSSDISDLIQQFPQLANETDNLGSALAGLNADNLSSMLSSIDEQMDKVTSDSDKKAFQSLKDQLIDSVDLSGVDKSKVTDGLRKLFEGNANDAVTRSLAKDQIANINKAFADELKTAEGKEIIYKLSLKPEASNWDLSEWQSQFDEELAKTSKNTLEKYVTQATNDLSALQTATSEASSTTGLTKSSIDSISQMFSGIPNFDADALFRNTADGVKLNTKALSSLLSVQHDIKATEFAKDIQKQTETIKKQNDAVQEAKGTADFDTQQTKLKDMLASLADMQQAQSQYHALYKQQQELFSDYGQWQQAQSTANAGDKYNNMVSGLKTAKEAWDKGLIGTDDFKSFAKLISPSGATDDVNFAENYSKAARYLTEDESGVKAFLNDLSSKGLADFNEESQQWSYNVKDMAEAAKQMGMGKEFMSNMFGRLEDYGFHNNVISDAEDGVLKLSDAYSNLAESEARLEDLKKNDPTNTTAIEQAEKEVSGYKQDIDELGTNLKEVASHTAENYNRELETAKNQMKTLADERERILKSNEYGDNTQAVADYMQSQIDQLGQNYGLDSSALQQQAEQAAKAYSDALQNATIENPVTPDFGKDTASADAYASAVDKVQQANKDNNQTLSDSIKTLQQYNSEQIKGIDLLDGAYDSDELKPAEQALDNICQSLGLTSEEAGLLGQVLESMGIIKPEVDDSEVKQAKTDAEETKQTYDNLGDSTVSINADVSGEDSVASFVDQCSSIQQGMTTTITATVSGESEVESLENGLEQIPDNTPTTVDVTVNNQQDLDNIQSKVDSLNAGGKDITLNAHIKPDSNSEVEVKAKDTTVKVTPDPKEVEVTAKPVKVDVQPSQKEVSVSAKVTNKPNATSQGTINYKKGNVEKADGTTSQGIINYKKGDVEKADGTVSTGIINYDLGNVATPTGMVATGVINYTLGSVAKPGKVAGTFGQSRAYAQGSLTDLFFSPTPAHANGNVSLEQDETALVNELGMESRVRDGVWSLIPGGAHMENLKKGDIIFSAQQTKDLLKSGATPGHARAYAQGSLSDISLTHAFDGGSGWGGFGGGLSNKTSVSSDSTSSSSQQATTSNTNATNANTSATEDNTKATKESKEAFDFVERYLNKFSKAVERISNTITDYVSSAFKTYQLKKQMKAINEEMVVNKQGYDTYMLKANSIELSDDYKQKVINGDLSIEDIDTSTDEGKKLAENIKNFETYIDSAQNCQDKIQELQNTLLELYDTLANMPIEKAEKAIDRLKTKYESLSKVSDVSSSGGSAIKSLQKVISKDNRELVKAQDKVDKAQAARNKAKATRSTTYKELDSAKTDTTKTGNTLIKATKNKTSDVAKALKSAAKSSTDKATYNAISQAIREGKAVNTKGLKGNILKYAKSYNSSLKQQNKVKSSVKAGKTVKTSTLSKSLRSVAKAYNADAKEQTAAQKAYDKAKDADKKALDKLSSAKNKKKDVNANTSVAQQVLIANRGQKSYVVQNRLLDAELANLKAQSKQRQTALKQVNGNVRDARKNRDNAVAVRKNTSAGILADTYINNSLSDKQRKAIKNGKEVSYEGIADPAIIKILEDYNGRVKIATDMNQKLNIQLDKQKDAINEATQAEAEYAQMRVENAQKKLENISSYYDSRTSHYENRNTLTNTYMDRMQTQGYNLSAKFYTAQIAQDQKILTQKKAELTAMQKQLQESIGKGIIQKGTQEYYDMQNSIEQVALSIEETTNDIVNMQAAIRDLKWEQFDQMQEAISRITSESDFLIELMSHQDMYDKDGKMTEQGLATMGLHGVNYNTYMAQADKYKKEMLKISKELADDPNNQKLIDRKNELMDAQQQAILSAENEKDAIKDLIQDGIDKELDALKDLIDKYKKGIESAKSLHEYQKKIAEQSENIASLQKQLASLQGDDSEENKAKLQKLKESLKDAQSDMEDTQYDKFISDQEELLDNLYNDYKDALDKRMDNVDALISDAIASINSNSSNISQTLQTESQKVGYTLSGEMQTIWTSQSQALSLYDGKFETRFTGVTTAIGNIHERQKDMISAINNMANAYISKVEELLKQPTQSNLARDESADSAAENAVNRDNRDYKTGGGKGDAGRVDDGLGVLDTGKKTTTTTTTTSKKNGNNKAEVGDKVTFSSGEYYGDSYGGHGSSNSYLGKKVYITKINKSSNYPYHISTGSKFGSGDLGWVKLSQLKGYASGIMKVPDDQLAWTQEQGEEAIIRNDGGILTPLSKDVSVLNADMTKNLWDFMSNPGSFLNDYSDSEKYGVKNEDNSSSVVNQFDNLTFNLPNVQNSDDFIKEMATNKKFEKMVCAMTVDRLNGGSSLAKYKYRK